MNGDQDSLYQYMQQQYGNPIPPSTPLNSGQQASTAVAQQQQTPAQPPATNTQNNWMLGNTGSPESTPIQMGNTSSMAKQAGMTSMMSGMMGGSAGGAAGGSALSSLFAGI